MIAPNNIQQAIDTAYQYVNELDQLTDSQEKELSDMIDRIQEAVEAHTIKCYIIESGLTKMVAWFIREYPESEIGLGDLMKKSY